MTETSAIAQTEAAHRPAWAGEGEWDEETIAYTRDIGEGRVFIDRWVQLRDGAVVSTGPTEINVRSRAAEGMSVEAARELVQDLIASIKILEAASA